MSSRSRRNLEKVDYAKMSGKRDSKKKSEGKCQNTATETPKGSQGWAEWLHLTPPLWGKRTVKAEVHKSELPSIQEEEESDTEILDLEPSSGQSDFSSDSDRELCEMQQREIEKLAKQIEEEKKKRKKKSRSLKVEKQKEEITKLKEELRRLKEPQVADDMQENMKGSGRSIRSVVVPKPGPDEIRQAVSLDRQRREREMSREREMFDCRPKSGLGGPSSWEGFPSTRRDLDSSDEEGSEIESISTVGGEKYLSTSSKLRSGMIRKAADRVLEPQVWPHVALRGEYISQEMSFSDLDFRTLVAGELEIISSPNTRRGERIGRTQLLKQLAYLYNSYSIEVIKTVYTSIVNRIEMRLLSWDLWNSEFLKEIQWVTTRHVPKQIQHMGSKSKAKKSYRNVSRMDESTPSGRGRFDENNLVWFCRDYQREVCAHKEAHEGVVKGRTVTVQHICAKCWLYDRVKKEHPEYNKQCPNYSD